MQYPSVLFWILIILFIKGDVENGKRIDSGVYTVPKKFHDNNCVKPFNPVAIVWESNNVISILTHMHRFIRGAIMRNLENYFTTFL